MSFESKMLEAAKIYAYINFSNAVMKGANAKTFKAGALWAMDAHVEALTEIRNQIGWSRAQASREDADSCLVKALEIIENTIGEKRSDKAL